MRVLMALPQQGTETFKICFVVKFHESVNGLTPTGDGNFLLDFSNVQTVAVLMALPQQGTETDGAC